MTDAPESIGPIRFQVPPPSGRERRAEAVKAVQQSLRGHTSAVGWLPEGLWPELDEARAELLRLRGEVLAAQDERIGLVARFAAEDQDHERALRQAQREGTKAQVKDRRASLEERQDQLAKCEERFWAAAVVMAEKADATVELVREHEDDWLGTLRGRLGPAEAKRLEAARLLSEAKAEEWQLYTMGDWLQKTADDGAFGRQPAPTPEEPPKQFSAEVAESMLTRPWHKRRDEELPVSWQELSEAQNAASPPVEPEPEPPEDQAGDGDPTGKVEALDPTVSGEAA